MDEAKEIARVRKGLQDNGFHAHSTYKEKHKEFCVLIYHPERKIEAWGFDENELAAYKQALGVVRVSP